MSRLLETKTALFTLGMLGVAAGMASAQSTPVFNKNYHIGFDRPESWGMRYFASSDNFKPAHS